MNIRQMIAATMIALIAIATGTSARAELITINFSGVVDINELIPGVWEGGDTVDGVWAINTAGFPSTPQYSTPGVISNYFVLSANAMQVSFTVEGQTYNLSSGLNDSDVLLGFTPNFGLGYGGQFISANIQNGSASIQPVFDLTSSPFSSLLLSGITPGSLPIGSGDDIWIYGVLPGNPGYELVENISASVRVSAVPLPAALPLFGAALAGFGGLGWWRKRKTTV